MANGIHHRTGMIDGSGMSAWSFDERGREIAEKRTIGTVTNALSMVHNVFGLPIQLTYPNGTVITYNYDAEGRTASVVDSAHGINYVTGPSGACGSSIGGLSPVCYAASGAVSSYMNGYTSSQPTYGVTVTDVYNSRLQPGTITASAAPGTILSYSYDFHTGAGNNGELWTLTNNLDNTHSKNFSYDAYNRISEYKTPNSTLWDVKYTIDAWGNLTGKSPQSGYGGENFASGAATNANQLVGYEYDGGTASIGNVTYDGLNRYTYDSENRIVSVTTAGVNFLYDGDSERVQKSNGKTYWGGSNGEPWLETDNSGTALNEYIYFNGRRIARRAISGGAVHYTFSDHLNSATVISDNQGTVQKQYDYAPYGELHWQSGTDPNHYQFAGKELDTETGDSYFGARYFRSPMGRFITPDWAATPEAVPYAQLGIPQTLNLYAYVANNPITGIDPDGHQSANGETPAPGHPSCTSEGAQCATSDNSRAQQQQTQQQAQQQTPYQAGNREANVIYHETAALKPIPGKSDAGDLHDARVDAAHVYNNLSDKSKFQDTGTLNSKEQQALAGGYPPGVRAYKDSVDAVSEAAHSADTTNGSKHFFVRDVTAGDAQQVPKWANGNQIVHGPFQTTAGGDGPIQKGDTVYIWINNTN